MHLCGHVHERALHKRLRACVPRSVAPTRAARLRPIRRGRECAAAPAGAARGGLVGLARSANAAIGIGRRRLRATPARRRPLTRRP
jgi:hypothetical protein